MHERAMLQVTFPDEKTWIEQNELLDAVDGINSRR